MWSYLRNRKQQVYVDGTLSDPSEVDIGVPQGSILGALLYNIYVLDLPEVVHECNENHPPRDGQITSSSNLSSNDEEAA